MQITAALVKELRERTGAGMMECKKALVDSGGDLEAAIETMRKSGQAKADKKAGRIAAEGVIIIQQQAQQAAMLEVNCETDFVSKGDDFKQFGQNVVHIILTQHPQTLETLLALPFDANRTIEEARKDLVGKIGENINIRRFVLMNHDAQSHLGVYLHGTRIGVLVALQGGDVELAKDIAMHIAASRPLCINAEQVPAAVIAQEKTIFEAQAAESGKPAQIIEKMVEGRLNKFLKEITLLGQPFVKDPDQSVEKLLADRQAQVTRFERFEVGEGIEKKKENFADEVKQQMQG